MLKFCMAVSAALALAGCASVASVNPDGGVVENASSAKEALHRADEHCAKSGRTARTLNYDALMGSMTFECVAK